MAGQISPYCTVQFLGSSSELMKLRVKTACYEHINFEQKAAHFVQKSFVGFGPKQSRNFWQTLGLFRYEIPIDSNITKWLNNIGFPVKLSTTGLADLDYYEFVMTGIQEICRKCNILPCIFDAAMFASFEKEWPEDDIVWQ